MNAQTVIHLATAANTLLRAATGYEGFDHKTWETASDMVDELAKAIDEEDHTLGDLFRDHIDASNLA